MSLQRLTGDLRPESLDLGEQGLWRQLGLEVVERNAQRPRITALHAARNPCAASATPSVTLTWITSRAASAGTCATSVAVSNA